MSVGSALLRGVLLFSLITTSAIVPPPLAADCAFPEDGRIVAIKVQSCEAIDGRTNKEVLQFAGKGRLPANIQKLYTGALVTDEHGSKWMYPSTEANPCGKFVKSAQVRMRAYLTCCDSGRWGKCVFGGRWLGDLDGKPINSFQ